MYCTVHTRIITVDDFQYCKVRLTVQCSDRLQCSLCLLLRIGLWHAVGRGRGRDAAVRPVDAAASVIGPGPVGGEILPHDDLSP